MRVWDDLATAALIGTERRTPELSAAGALGELLGKIETPQSERGLLDAAAAVAPFIRAGKKLSPNVAPIPNPCPPERQPVCSLRVEACLGRILGGDQGDVLDEWLVLASRTNVLAPPRLLPALLSAGRARRDIRPALAPVLGERGSWLARLNPAWGFAVQVEETADADTLWNTGTKDERTALVKKLRATVPDAARQLVESTWKQDPPEERAAFLATFSTGLTIADEPLLETALDDKRKEVRRAASDLLARLPESQLVKRILERTAPLLALVRDEEKKKNVVEVTLPDLPDKAHIRDGIEEIREKNPKIGVKAATLRQMLAVVPPGWWASKWNLTPEEVIEAATDLDHRDAVIDGWSEASVRHHDQAWCEALFARRAAKDDIRAALFNELPQPARERFAAAILADLTELQSYQTVGLLKSCTFAWNAELSNLFVESLRATVATLQTGNYSNNYWSFFQELERFGNLAQPTILAEVAAVIDANREKLAYFFNHFERLAARLEFRAEMQQAFQEIESRSESPASAGKI